MKTDLIMKDILKFFCWIRGGLNKSRPNQNNLEFLRLFLCERCNFLCLAHASHWAQFFCVLRHLMKIVSNDLTKHFGHKPWSTYRNWETYLESDNYLKTFCRAISSSLSSFQSVSRVLPRKKLDIHCADWRCVKSISLDFESPILCFKVNNLSF